MKSYKARVTIEKPTGERPSRIFGIDVEHVHRMEVDARVVLEAEAKDMINDMKIDIARLLCQWSDAGVDTEAGRAFWQEMNEKYNN